MFAAPGTHQNARRFSSKGKSGLEVRASASNAAPVVLAGDVAASSDATAPSGFVWKGAKIVPALLSSADANHNPSPRCRAHAAAALINFVDMSGPELLTPYLDAILQVRCQP